MQLADYARKTTDSSLTRSKKRMGEIVMLIKNMITGEYMDKENLLRAWQEFIFARQDTIEQKLASGELSSKHSNVNQQIEELLEGLSAEQAAAISDAITELSVTSTYIHYNKGFFDGLKIAMVMGNL